MQADFHKKYLKPITTGVGSLGLERADDCLIACGSVEKVAKKAVRRLVTQG